MKRFNRSPGNKDVDSTEPLLVGGKRDTREPHKLLQRFGLFVMVFAFGILFRASYAPLLVCGGGGSRGGGGGRGLKAASSLRTAAPTRTFPRVLAIVFPQFHPDPLNDKLWGVGFTDWNNLKKAPSHNRLGDEIPRPTELGYYDLRALAPRKMQGELAKEYGIDGFVYHHYWFYDKEHTGPNLHAPLMEMLKDGHPNVPFFLNWCADTWTDTWMGQTNSSNWKTKRKSDNVLQFQRWPKEDDPAIREHYNWLRQFFHHPNYIKVKGQPVFMMYKDQREEMYPVIEALRRFAQQDGFPGIYINAGKYRSQPELFPEGRFQGMDGSPKHRRLYPDLSIVNASVSYPYPYDWMQGQIYRVPDWCVKDYVTPPQDISRETIGLLLAFDNTPRRAFETANLWSAGTPDEVVKRFHDNLFAAIYYETCCLFTRDLSTGDATFIEADEESFVLVNSMNEWAEGMSLEPSTTFGRRFLEAWRAAKEEVAATGCITRSSTH